MSFDAWTAAFVKAQKELPQIHKTQTADTGRFTYSYADLNHVLSLVLPVLNKHKLAVAQATVVGDLGVGVETRIYHEAGHVEVFGPLFLPADRTAQSAGSAITYARRYSLLAALGLAPDEDDDGASSRVGGRSSSSQTQDGPSGPKTAPHEHQCPKCKGEVWDNTQDAEAIERNWPRYKCKNDRIPGCNWKTWDDTYFDPKPIREDFESSQPSMIDDIGDPEKPF